MAPPILPVPIKGHSIVIIAAADGQKAQGGKIATGLKLAPLEICQNRPRLDQHRLDASLKYNL